MTHDDENQERLYNIRIVRCYFEYLEKYYQDIDRDEILEFTGLTRSELADDGYWCTQPQVDRFNKITVKLTENPDIAREVGRYTVSTKAYQTMRQFTFGFISPSTAYRLIPKIVYKLSKAAIITAKPYGMNRIEMTSKPAPGVHEKEFQCRNRLGHIEALAAVFTGEYASVEHTSCFHKGDEVCRYIISWKEPLFLKLRSFRNILFFFGLMTCGALSFFIPHTYNIILLSTLLILLVSITFSGWYFEKDTYQKQVNDQAHTAELLMQESNIRSNDARLIQEIGQAISSVLDIDTLIKTIMETLRQRLDFDRGTVLLANSKKTLLQYIAGYGFTPDQEEFFGMNDLSLNNPDSEGPFVVTFKEMRPQILENKTKNADDLTRQSKDLLLLSDADSFICVPIVFENQALGVLYVDRVKSLTPLKQSDLDKIMGIAPQIAISINNARTYEKMEASEERYRGILEEMEEAYYEVDLKGNFTFFNDSMCKTLGYSRFELMGMNNRDYTSPETARKAFLIFTDIYRTGSPRSMIDYDIIRQDGEKRTLDTSILPIKKPSGEIIGFRGVLRDVTERKIMEKAQEQSEARYRLLAENASDIIFTMDNNLKFTYISPSVERIRGYTFEEAMSQTPEEALTPASLEVAMKAFAEEMEIETRETKNLWRTRTIELEERCKDGSTIWTESSFSPLRDEENKFAGFLGITRDITERNRIEEEKKRLEDQLVRTQKIEAIGTLAGGIAHDFNNLLTGILGNVSLVLMKMDESNPFRERLKNIEDYVQRGSDLTKQLLGFARGGKYEVKPTDLGAFIRKSSEMFGRTKKEIRIQYEIQNGLWAAEVDRGQMEQVLLNLLVNAWQAMPGGGNLYLSVENVELHEIDVRPYNLRPGKFIKVTVTDTGIGMSDAIKTRIFEPFFTTKERDRGTGLGLASVYGIIKNHGGFINVESREGQGASFMFYLPASEKAPIGDGGSIRDDIQLGSETILLIDDESMILDIGSKMLEGLNYKVITAVGGKQGLQNYEKDRGQIDLVILDMIMPDLSGKETFNALLRINPSVRVLLSSGYSLDAQAREIMQSGCKGFIQKPFTMMELSMKIRGVLDE